MKVYTGGDVIVNKLEIGDIIYECEYGLTIKSMVITVPERSREGQWTWKAERCDNKNIIDYLVTEGFSHYAPKLYFYEAYGRG